MMALHRFLSRQVVATDMDTAWRFFSDPRNLALMTPPSLGLTPTCPVPDEMYPGMIITYTVKPGPGIRVEWVTEITHVVDRVRFVDEQRSGPYKFWHHQHHFREVPDGVEMRDIVHYRLPFGTIADVVAGGIVKRQVRKIFEHRRRVLDDGAVFRKSWR